MWKKVTLVLVLSGILVSCRSGADSSTSSMSTNSGEEAIHRFYAQWFAAMETGDIDGFLSLLADDFMLKLPGQPPITDRDVLRKGLEQFHATFSEEVDYEIQGVGVGEEWAWVQIRERVVLTPRNGDPTQELSGIHLGILVREADGDWLLHRDVSSFDGES